MERVRDDLVDLFDFVWTRFRERMEGLEDEELGWTPTEDPDLTLSWQLGHIAAMLDEPRNSSWLDVVATHSTHEVAGRPNPTTGLMAALDEAFARWRAVLVATSDSSLAQPIGPLAGPYADGSRRSFVVHVADELIHHTAQAALFRDLYPSRGVESGGRRSS